MEENNYGFNSSVKLKQTGLPMKEMKYSHPSEGLQSYIRIYHNHLFKQYHKISKDKEKFKTL